MIAVDRVDLVSLCCMTVFSVRNCSDEGFVAALDLVRRHLCHFHEPDIRKLLDECDLYSRLRAGTPEPWMTFRAEIVARMNAPARRPALRLVPPP